MSFTNVACVNLPNRKKNRQTLGTSLLPAPISGYLRVLEDHHKKLLSKAQVTRFPNIYGPSDRMDGSR